MNNKYYKIGDWYLEIISNKEALSIYGNEYKRVIFRESEDRIIDQKLISPMIIGRV